MLAVPAFMIISFSVNSSSVNYGIFELSYFCINGAVTWFALYNIIRVLQFDKSNKLEILAYLAPLYVVVAKGIFSVIDKTFTNEANTDTTGSANLAEANPVPDSAGTKVQSEDVFGEADLGTIEYIAVAVMLLPRIFYYFSTFRKKAGE